MLLYTYVSFILPVSLVYIYAFVGLFSRPTVHLLYNEGIWIISDKGKVQWFDVNF